MGALPEEVPAEEAGIRNSLVGAALGGIAITRYIWRMEPIASMSRETVVALHGPVVQGFLTGPSLPSRPWRRCPPPDRDPSIVTARSMRLSSGR